MALGFLTKLQPALIVPFFAIGVYFLWRKELKFFADTAHLPGIAAFLVIISGWLYLAYSRGGGDYLFGLLFKKTALTFFQTSGHLRSFHYYFLNFPADFLPWTLFFPSAIVYGLRQEKKEEAIFLLLWFSLIFLFFSFAKAKRELYILPIYPAAALMVGKFWADLSSKEERPRLLSWPLFLLLAILLITGVASPFMVMKFGHRYLSKPLEIGLVSAAILVGGSIFAFLGYQSNRKALTFFVVVFMMFTIGLYGTFRIFPEINRYKSARPLSQSIVRIMKPGDQLGVYRLQGADFNYYTGCDRMKRFEQEEALKEFLRSSGRVFCVLRQRHYERLKMDPTLQIYEIKRGRVGHRRLVVISNTKGYDQD